jgi:hypothetical protein
MILIIFKKFSFPKGDLQKLEYRPCFSIYSHMLVSYSVINDRTDID